MVTILNSVNLKSNYDLGIFSTATDSFVYKVFRKELDRQDRQDILEFELEEEAKTEPPLNNIRRNQQKPTPKRCQGSGIRKYKTPAIKNKRVIPKVENEELAILYELNKHDYKVGTMDVHIRIEPLPPLEPCPCCKLPFCEPTMALSHKCDFTTLQFYRSSAENNL